MSEQYSADDIPQALDRLVETWRDCEFARTQVHGYKATVAQPRRLHRFKGVEDLQDYHRRKVEYEARLANVQKHLEAAQSAYEQASEEVRKFLPSGSSLLYSYQGEREDIKGTRHVIRYERDRVTVEPYPSS